MCVTNLAISQIGPVIQHRPKIEKSARLPSKHAEISADYFKKLAAAIVKDSYSEKDKAEAIYRWLANNISYDHELRSDRNLQKQVYTSEASVINRALQQRKALCGGYAFLFRELSRAVGLKSTVIHGFSKNYMQNKRNTSVPNHTWNAVALNGKWYLLDITMARSQGSAGNPSSYWFMTDPTYFIKTHFPEELKWSLLNDPLSRSEFDRLTVP